MDQNTLDQLKSAFMAAPTNQLAIIICAALIDHNNDEELNDFSRQITDLLSDQDLLIVANTLYQRNKCAQILLLLTLHKSSHFKLYIKSMSQMGQQNEAQKIYQDGINDNPSLKSSEIEQFLQLAPADSATEITDKKTKLKVVEKIDVAEITDLAKYQQKVTDFSDVVGLTEIKKQISKKIIMPFQKPSLFQRFKKKVGGGVLLYGPPGCGKTLLARATAGECNAAFYNVEISDILDMYIGESEQKLHAIFEKARAETPCVLFFDEFEAMAGKRESNRNASFNNIVSQFLTELDGFSQNNAGILVLASTNVPWSIDSAFLRPGRFDRMFFVPPPDKQARQGIIEHHMQDRPAEDNINYAALAAKCKGYSGADLFNLVEMVADEAIDETIETGNDVLINNSHFKQALSTAHSTTIEWLTTARNYARYANDGGRYNDVLKFIQKHGK
ncbi:MAG: ATP-binding protein [Alcanivoracaceae bacterium]|nr:ATP-binding protein [Alcanivoracaceae bacterium]